MRRKNSIYIEKKFDPAIESSSRKARLARAWLKFEMSTLMPRSGSNQIEERSIG